MVTTEETSTSFFDEDGVEKETIHVGDGVPFGLKRVSNSKVGIAGVYGTWGQSYDNSHLRNYVQGHLTKPLGEDESLNLAELGFVSRHCDPDLNPAEHIELELEVGTRLLKEAVNTNGWKPGEVEGVLIGISLPVVEDYVPQIAHRAGIPNSALKVSVHKACDGSVGALNLALNPTLAAPGQSNIAQQLAGKKVLVGGIEGLTRLVSRSNDKNALQLFGNGAGVIGVIPGQTFKFLVGQSFEAFDEEGLLAMRMYYPHSRHKTAGGSFVEVSQAGQSHIRVAGMMHEPDGDVPVEMAGMMGMVKLFVRSGVQAVNDVYQKYQAMMDRLGEPARIAVAIVHHANYKINKLKEKHLANLGIKFPMPWLLKEFGNVSAASNMIAFLRELPSLKPGDHILIDGFGAGTYYDVLAVEIGS